MNQLLELAIKAAIDAGKKICQVYNSADFQIEQKADNTPLTIADRQSHQTIVDLLSSSQLPILSEEGKDIPYEQRKNWELFWLVDPLDGTKEFIKRNGEFTVNIALIQNQLPVLGVIYVPAKRLLYFASEQIGSYMYEQLSPDSWTFEQIFGQSTKLPHTFPSGKYIVVASRSHINQQTMEYIERKVSQCPEYEIISIGSSLKFCLVAEGKAHEYPRFGPTMEWDTAAGHAIVKFSGGKVVQADSGQELVYNKPDLHNPNFIVLSNFLLDQV